MLLLLLHAAVCIAMPVWLVQQRRVCCIQRILFLISMHTMRVVRSAVIIRGHGLNVSCCRADMLAANAIVMQLDATAFQMSSTHVQTCTQRLAAALVHVKVPHHSCKVFGGHALGVSLQRSHHVGRTLILGDRLLETVLLIMLHGQRAESQRLFYPRLYVVRGRCV